MVPALQALGAVEVEVDAPGASYSIAATTVVNSPKQFGD
jgi:hypothetical protein